MKLLDKLLVTFTALFIVTIILVLLFPENIEIRSEFYQIIFNGYAIIISLLILLILLVLKGILNLVNEKWTEGLLLVLLPGAILFFCFIFFSLFIGDFGVFKSDIIIYESKNDKIVFQYYETGITGNPNSRILKIADDLNSGLRKYEEIKLSNYDSVKFIDFSNLKANCNSIPKSISYRGTEYKLKFCK